MSFTIPVILYIIIFIGIIALQVLTFKSERKLFPILAFVIGAVSGVLSLMITTYYGTATERIKNEAAMLTAEALDKASSFETYTIICLCLSIVLFATLIATAAVLVFKKILENKA